MRDLEIRYCENEGNLKVDFELAVASLEEEGLIDSGPYVPRENVPGSGVFFLGVYSKREYVCLNEAGYRVAASLGEERSRSSVGQVNISGGFFNNPQIAAGHQINQTQAVRSKENVATALRDLLQRERRAIDDSTEQDLQHLVTSAEYGNAGEAKSIFNKLFGLCSEATKQVGWGIVTELVTKALGM
jgi:hypothetical protein